MEDRILDAGGTEKTAGIGDGVERGLRERGLGGRPKGRSGRAAGWLPRPVASVRREIGRAYLSHGRELRSRCGGAVEGRFGEPLSWRGDLGVGGQTGPMVRFAVPHLKGAGFNLEDPAVELEGTGMKLGEDVGVRFEVLELEEDVQFGERDQGFVLRGSGMEFVESAAGTFCVAQPVLNMRHVGKLFGVEEALHGTAIGVATNDDMANFEAADGKLNSSGGRFGLVTGRHDVTRIPADEHVAWGGLGNEIQGQPGIGAPDDENFGLLSGGQTFEEFAVRREDMILEVLNALKNLLHNAYP